MSVLLVGAPRPRYRNPEGQAMGLVCTVRALVISHSKTPMLNARPKPVSVCVCVCPVHEWPESVRSTSGQRVSGPRVARECPVHEWPESVRSTSGQRMSGPRVARECPVHEWPESVRSRSTSCSTPADSSDTGRLQLQNILTFFYVHFGHTDSESPQHF